MPTTSNFGWTTPADTDLVKDGAAAIRTLGNGIDTSFVDLKGGTTNQVLAKNSDTDLDFKWVADASGIPATIFDAKGDLIAASAADTAERLPIGANGYVLTADSSQTTGLRWAAPVSGGKLLQVVYGSTTTNVDNTTTTYVDTGLTATITPSSNTSKILVIVNQTGINKTNGNSQNATQIQTLRGATQIGLVENIGYTNTTLDLRSATYSISILDEPATTSATTYKTQFRNLNASPTVSVQASSSRSTIILMEIGA